MARSCLAPLLRSTAYASLNMKDPIFSPIYLLWFTLIARLVNSKGALARSPGFFIALLVSGVLCALTKKTGVYVVEHGDKIDKDQHEAIDDVLRYDMLAERYEPAWADPVKCKYVYNAPQKAWDAYFAV